MAIGLLSFVEDSQKECAISHHLIWQKEVVGWAYYRNDTVIET